MPSRSLGKMVLLTIITLGIYQLFWLYKTRQELAVAGYKTLPVIWLFAPYLVIIVMLMLQLGSNFIFSTVTSDSLVSSGSDSLGGKVFGILSALVTAVSITAAVIFPFIWFFKYSRAVEGVTHGSMSTAIAYVLWLVLFVTGFVFIWPIIIQDSFNKVAAAGPVPHAPTLAPPLPPATH